MKNLVVDCEVVGNPNEVGWSNYGELGISVAVVWDIDADEWFIFTANPHVEGTLELKELPKLLDGNNIIGHNVEKFDIPLIKEVAGDFVPGRITDFWRAIHEATGIMVALQHIVTHTGIGSKTLSSGAEAPVLWAKGQYDEVIDYCKNDVLLEGTVYLQSKKGVLEFPFPASDDLMMGLYIDAKENLWFCIRKVSNNVANAANEVRVAEEDNRAPGTGKSIRIEFDGACEPRNPKGIATYGYVIYKGDEKIHEGKGIAATPFSDESTNNVAEYTALIEALKYVHDNLKDYEVSIQGDSELVIKQLQGEYAVRASNIIDRFSEAKSLIDELNVKSIKWVPREENEVADALSHDAYVDYLKAHPGVAKKISGYMATEKQMAFMRRLGLEPYEFMSKKDASRLIDRELKKRRGE